MHGEYKIPGGKLVVVDFNVTDQTLCDVRVAGDFFLDPDEALDRINSALNGALVTDSAEQLATRIENVLRPDDVLFGVNPLGVAIAVRRALGQATSWKDLTFDIIHGPVLHPVTNMALDQVLPEEMAAGRRGPVLRIWEWDKPLVVMGSFQSYANEINPAGLKKHNMVVSRRITGGGTMFMEAGNCITYSLVVPASLVEGLSFEQSYPFLDDWVMGALEEVGVKARYVPLNDIASTVGKIGGAAQKRFSSGVVLHHVTMSYDIDAAKMLDCMRIGQEKIRDKGTASAIKRVDPMKSQTGLPRETIIESFIDHFSRKYDSRRSALRSSEIARAEELVATKFLTEEWIHRVP